MWSRYALTSTRRRRPSRLSNLVSILHIINGLSVGGAETMLYKLLSRTDRERFEPVVVSLTDRGVLGAEIEALGVPVYTIGMKFGTPTPSGAWRLLSFARRLKPDLIQGWMSHGNLAATLAGTAVPGPVPILWNIRQSIYSLGYEKPTTVAAIKLCAWLSGLPAKILYNSRTAAFHHQALGYQPEKTVVIPNGFDTRLFVPSAEARRSVRSELGVDEDTILVGLVSSYHHLKDHANFLRAAALLLKERSDVRFVLCGKGVDRGNPALLATVENLDLAEQVHLLGVRRDVWRLTAALDIASSASYSEAFSNAIGEAMACGVPCVATDVGDSAWIVGETGRVVPPRNPEAMRDAWSALIRMGAAARHALGTKARQRIKEQFSIDTVVRRYEEVYGGQLQQDSLDQKVIEGFGDEWSRFDQSVLSRQDHEEMFQAYFSTFPWKALPEGSVGFDLGCGSGRWAKLVAPRVGELHCIDPSTEALAIAKKNLADQRNCRFHLASVEDIPLADSSADFGYTLGVLHHIPNTEFGLRRCVFKLKKGAPFLLYLYYKFDNRPRWFRLAWKISEAGRFVISRAPFRLRYALSQVIALAVYLPASKLSLLLEKLGYPVDPVPLSYYRDKSFYVMRTDALDRFGTRLEKRFTKEEMRGMMERAGLERITFSERPPYWCAVGYRS